MKQLADPIVSVHNPDEDPEDFTPSTYAWREPTFTVVILSNSDHIYSPEKIDGYHPGEENELTAWIDVDGS